VSRLGVVDDAQLALPPTAPPPSPSRQGGVRVKGVGDLLIRFGKCCHPIPGDPIIGFITRGKGVTVHLRNCQTIMGERETARMIEVEWEGEVQQTYPISIRLEAYDRTGLLSDVTQVVAENKVNILAAERGRHARQNGHGPRHPGGGVGRPAGPRHEPLEQLKDVISVQRDLG
jgi:(p)ppGpp synthase/HD superfamily hydrolase